MADEISSAAIDKIMESMGPSGISQSDMGADAYKQLKEKVLDLVGQFKEVSTEAFISKTKKVVKQIASDIKDQGLLVALRRFGEKASEVLSETIGIDIADVFGFDTTKMKAKADEVGNALQGAFNVMGIDVPLNVPLNIPDKKEFTKKLQSLVLGIKDIDMGDAVLYLGMAKGLDAAGQKLDQLGKFSKHALGNLDSYRETAGEISKIQINPFGTSIEVGNSTSSAKDAALKLQKDFAEQVIDLRVGLSISSADAESELKTVYSGLQNYGSQLTDIKVDIAPGKAVMGAQAIAYAARATGIDISTMTADINEMTFTMGSSGQQVSQNLVTIAKAASNTLLPVSKFQKEVMAAAGHFSLFGDNTEEAAAMLDRFISKADPKRIGASVAAFQSVATGIAGMTDEMKAFVGMGTELAGGGGAIEAIVRMDEALQSGDKDALQGIFNEAIARIEELSGAPVMTLKEAVSSGQESTFNQQAKMLEQMGLSHGRAQASDIFEASKRGTIDVESIRAQTGGVGLGAGAIDKATMGRGSLDVAKEMAGGAADLARYQLMYKTGSENVMKHSDDLAKKFIDLGQAVAGKDSIIKALEMFTPSKITELITLSGSAAASAALESGTSSINTSASVAADTAASRVTGAAKESVATGQTATAEAVPALAAMQDKISKEQLAVLNKVADSAAKMSNMKLEITLKGGAEDLITVVATRVAERVVERANNGN